MHRNKVLQHSMSNSKKTQRLADRSCRQQTEKQNIALSHRIAIGIFSVLLLYGIIIVRRCSLPTVDGVCYDFHAVDFGMGFCSKFLPGAIYNLFVKSPSPESATVYESVLLVLFYAAVSFLLERMVFVAPEKHRPVAFVLLAFYLTGPATFAPYIYNLGMLDVYWLFLSVPFIVMLQNRYTRLVLPLLIIPAVMIHFGAMITCVPFFALLILYELTRAEENYDRRQLTAVFCAMVVLAVSTFLYFSINDRNNIKLDPAEFHQVMEARGAKESTYYYGFYTGEEYASYDQVIHAVPELERYADAPVEILFPDHIDNFFVKMLNVFSYQIQMHFFIYSNLEIAEMTFPLVALLFVVLLPSLVFFWWIYAQRFKEAKGKRLDRFVYFCLLVFFPFTTFGSLLISTDSTRWVYHAYLSLFTMLLYLLYRERETAYETIAALLRRIPRFAVGLYYLICFFTVLDPYV